MRRDRFLFAFAALVFCGSPAVAQDPGREIYMQRCFWCHGEEGRGDGPSAVGMFPRPRDLVAAEYKIRSTPHGELPTGEDVLRTVSEGLPNTPMPGWKDILSPADLRSVVEYIQTLSPRFGTEQPTPVEVPTGPGSVERGAEVYREARCTLCHGEESRGDGLITTVLNFEWGLPHTARDLTRGWTFKGGHEAPDIYQRITTGLNGTPMGPYGELLSEQDRWDLAHYVASLDEEPEITSEDFVVIAARIEGELPADPGAQIWDQAESVLVPLAGQVVLDAPLRWWIPTAGSLNVRALWNESGTAYLLEWDDPTPPEEGTPDAARIQFAETAASRPYFLLGDADNPVRVWHWRSGDVLEEWTATGADSLVIEDATFQASSLWEAGRWHLLLQRPRGGIPSFEGGGFLPILFTVQDGANGEGGNAGSISTWLYTVHEQPASSGPWFEGASWLLGVIIGLRWITRRLRS